MNACRMLCWGDTRKTQSEVSRETGGKIPCQGVDRSMWSEQEDLRDPCDPCVDCHLNSLWQPLTFTFLGYTFTFLIYLQIDSRTWYTESHC